MIEDNAVIKLHGTHLRIQDLKICKIPCFNTK